MEFCSRFSGFEVSGGRGDEVVVSMLGVGKLLDYILIEKGMKIIYIRMK